jgi:hypothetical protein
MKMIPTPRDEKKPGNQRNDLHKRNKSNASNISVKSPYSPRQKRSSTDMGVAKQKLVKARRKNL